MLHIATKVASIWCNTSLVCIYCLNFDRTSSLLFLWLVHTLQPSIAGVCGPIRKTDWMLLKKILQNRPQFCHDIASRCLQHEQWEGLSRGLPTMGTMKLREGSLKALQYTLSSPPHTGTGTQRILTSSPWRALPPVCQYQIFYRLLRPGRGLRRKF